MNALIIRKHRRGLHFFLSFLLLSFFHLIFSQSTVNAQCFKENKAFKAGEKLSFLIYYNMAFIWVDAGKAIFEVKSSVYKNKPVYKFDSYGTSLPSHDWFFKVRERYISYLDTISLKPLRCERKAIEGSYYVNEAYDFDFDNKKIYTYIENSKVKPKKDTLSLSGCVFDVLSAIYYFRNIDFSYVNENEKIPTQMVIDNKVHNLYVRYLGKEIIEDRNKQKYRCIKFSAMLVSGTIFQGGEELTVWVTDDKNKIPILIEAGILVGSIKVYLSEVKGLRHEFSSKIQK